MKDIVLKNGLKVLYYPMLNTHSVTIGLYIKSGIAYEAKEEVGITHLLEHLHFRRLGNMSQEELYYKMESIGSGLRCNTHADFLRFTMKVIPGRVQECLSIFINIMCVTDWTLEEFEKEKQLVINQVKENDGYVYINDEIRKVIFRNTSLSNNIVGTIESLQQLKKEDVQSYKSNVFNSNNMILCITGCINEKEIQDALKELENFEVINGTEKQWMEVPKAFHHRKPDIIFHSTDDDILDVNLSFDISGDTYLSDPFTIINCILGEGVGSNLQKQIREKMGYTFDIYSYIEKYKDFAILHVRFSVKKEIFELCFKEIIQVIKRMKTNITREDLDISLPFYTTNKIFLEDDTEGMNLQLAYEDFILNNKINNCKLENNNITINQLQEVSKKIFVPENVCVVVVGNTNRMTKKMLRSILNEL